MTGLNARQRQTGSIRIVIIPIIVVVLGIGGYFVYQYFLDKESTDDAQVDGHIYMINTRVGGAIAEVNVEENRLVEAGAVLVKIDDRDYTIALALAEADLADAQARQQEAQAQLPVAAAEAGGQLSSSQGSLMRAEGVVESARKDIDVARARLALAHSRAVEAQTNYSKAAKDRDRLKPLIEKDEISQQQYDAVVSAADAAKAASDSAAAAIREAESGVAAAEARVMEARGGVGMAQAEIQTANAGPQQVAASRARITAAGARIAQAKAALEQARANLEYTIVRAPVAGSVSRKSVEPGQIVQPGQPLLAIVASNEVWITANFKETQLDKMRPGQTAVVTVDAYGGARFNARIDSISAATGAKFSLLPAENASGNFVKVVQRVPVKLILDRIDDASRVLRPGMSVGVTVLTK